MRILRFFPALLALLVVAQVSIYVPVYAIGQMTDDSAQSVSNSNLNNDEAEGGLLRNPLASKDINSLDDLLAALLNVLVQIGVVVLVVMLVYTGFLFITAQGNPEALSKAKSALLWTVIGGAVVLGAGVIAGAIKSTVGAL